MNSDPFEHLQALGFSDYEARAYVSLLRSGPLSGYQLARASGIPRPNVYPVLDRLQQRGAVARIEVKGGVRYAALPSREMLDRLAREVTGRLQQARDAMERLEEVVPGDQVWNVQGYEAVLARAEAAIDAGRSHLLIGLWSEESARLAGAVSRAQARGVKVTTLCIQGCPDECGGCRGEIYRYPLAGQPASRWLVLSVDEKEVMVGQVQADGSAAGAVTRLEAFVFVGSHYLRNAIAAAEIVRSLGPRLPQLLDEQALTALSGAGLAAGGQSWFEQVLAAVTERAS